MRQYKPQCIIIIIFFDNVGNLFKEEPFGLASRQ